ncbi:hypothetical protein IGI04_039948 [Brassica rapa subsp. trilocularis]|uniref:Uncharacterized protein n=1 Tax=Brassica rapa subsp. trilocularis TaxID=1813537 RepID=A0ABQ7KLE0_BRACM|nr:hypothetical protein IGI04_039948 [Brassica rapa subsp. trilocularis]
MPPVSGQSASCSRSYARFTEEWSVCLARGSCREEKAASIDAALCTSIDGDLRSYLHISTRAMKRGFLGPSRKKPAGQCTIRKSKGEVSIDSLQAASIDSIDKKSIWRDEEGRPCSLTGQLINAEGSVISDIIDVAETNTFNLTSQWEDIKEAFIGKIFSEAVATRSKRLDYMIKNREKGIMISMSQILDFVYSEENGDIGTPTTHVKQPNIQVHHADESKQKDKLNREKLVNHDTVEDDEYHVSGEQSKVEEADTKDPTAASIDSSNSESNDIRTSETIDTNICHRSIPSTIPGATTVSASRRSALQNTVLELHPAYISLVGQHSFHGFPHEDPTSHLETFVDLASTTHL